MDRKIITIINWAFIIIAWVLTAFVSDLGFKIFCIVLNSFSLVLKMVQELMFIKLSEL